VWGRAEINDRGDSSLLQPVMLYIHGGHLEWTPPDGELWASNFSAATNQVVTTLNFRNGPMGFLPVREVGAEGGTGGLNGVYDLIVALRWIQDNIHHFGGDPNRVTLYGGSTGGSLVCLLAASPLAAGLFDSVVIASGPCHGLKELLPASVGTAYTSLFRQMLARHLHNMTAEDVDVEYMRSLPAETLIASWDDVGHHVDLNDKPPLFHDANFAFMDGWVLSKRPSTYFKAGQGNMRSAIMGVTSLDGVLFYPHNHTYPGSSYPADRTTWLLSKGEVLKSVPFQVPGFRVPFPREYEEQVLAWTNTTFGVFK
jgi:carboxylesterase type B